MKDADEPNVFDPHHVVVELAAAKKFAVGLDKLSEWLDAIEKAGDPGPVHFCSGRAWTDASAGIFVSSALHEGLERVRALGCDIGAAAELERCVSEAVRRFASEHGELLGRAMELLEGAGPEELEHAARWALLGHAVSRLYAAQGREQTENVLTDLLDQLEAIDADDEPTKVLQ